MTNLFKAPKLPDVQTVEVPVYTPPAKTTTPPATEEIKAEEAKTLAAEKKKIRRGRKGKGTILTGPLGLTEPATVTRKTLLGD